MVAQAGKDSGKGDHLFMADKVQTYAATKETNVAIPQNLKKLEINSSTSVMQARHSGVNLEFQLSGGTQTDLCESEDNLVYIKFQDSHGYLEKVCLKKRKRSSYTTLEYIAKGFYVLLLKIHAHSCPLQLYS